MILKTQWGSHLWLSLWSLFCVSTKQRTAAGLNLCVCLCCWDSLHKHKIGNLQATAQELPFTLVYKQHLWSAISYPFTCLTADIFFLRVLQVCVYRHVFKIHVCGSAVVSTYERWAGLSLTNLTLFVCLPCFCLIFFPNSPNISFSLSLQYPTPTTPERSSRPT